jgi:hypothetical protein
MRWLFSWVLVIIIKALTAFKVYTLYIHRCHVLWYCWFPITLFSFTSFPKFHRVVHYCKRVFIWSCCFCVCLSFGSIFHVWEKTCGLCLSEPSLLHLPWCLPTASTYLPTTCCYHSLWLSHTTLCIYSTFSWSIHLL